MLWGRGVARIAGIDEAGRGAWAGPVVAAAVILPRNPELPRQLGLGPVVRDSKQLSPAQRSQADEVVRSFAVAVGIGVVPPSIVDEVGLSAAGQLAFWRAVSSLPVEPDYLLVDGFPLWSPRHPQLAIIDGDATCASIASASIVAKVARDRLMDALDEAAPGYGFGHHRGYGTAAHAQALGRLGPSIYHRRSYEPVARVGSWDE